MNNFLKRTKQKMSNKNKAELGVAAMATARWRRTEQPHHGRPCFSARRRSHRGVAARGPGGHRGARGRRASAAGGSANRLGCPDVPHLLRFSKIRNMDLGLYTGMETAMDLRRGRDMEMGMGMGKGVGVGMVGVSSASYRRGARDSFQYDHYH